VKPVVSRVVGCTSGMRWRNKVSSTVDEGSPARCDELAHRELGRKENSLLEEDAGEVDGVILVFSWSAR
jgi:hypothetical protein